MLGLYMTSRLIVSSLSQLGSKRCVANCLTTQLPDQVLLKHQEPILKHFRSPPKPKGGLVGCLANVEGQSTYSTVQANRAVCYGGMGGFFQLLSRSFVPREVKIEPDLLSQHSAASCDPIVAKRNSASFD